MPPPRQSPTLHRNCWDEIQIEQERNKRAKGDIKKRRSRKNKRGVKSQQRIKHNKAIIIKTSKNSRCGSSRAVILGSYPDPPFPFKSTRKLNISKCHWHISKEIKVVKSIIRKNSKEIKYPLQKNKKRLSIKQKAEYFFLKMTKTIKFLASLIQKD